MEYRKKFVAVDLETTHLDQREGKIMEVGAAEFELYGEKGGKGVEVRFGRTFSSLVNPEIESSETALAITGIKKDELKTAPKWKEVKDQVQKFIGDAVIVGHNVGFDMGYLENQGLKLKNNLLDTLEVARTLLPLEDSHSLESLAEGFAILKDAPHRALVDCQNTARVLAAILNAFLSYPGKLQAEVKGILGKSRVDFLDLVAELPIQHLGVGSWELGGEPEKIQIPTTNFQLQFTDKTIYCYPLSFNRLNEVLSDLANRKENAVIGLSHSAFLADFPGQKLMNPRFALCEKRFSWLVSEDELSPEMARIAAKILILQETRKSLDLSLLKWSPDEIGLLHYLSVNLDLCRQHRCAYAAELEKKSLHPRFGDLETVFELGRLGVLGKSAQSILFDLSAIEDEFTESVMQTWNLRRVRNLFAPLYQIDDAQPSMVGALPEETEQIFNEIDLFFGILHLVYLKREGEFSENLVIDEQERNSERFEKLFHPAQKFQNKLKNFNVYLQREAKLAGSDLRFEMTALQTALASAQEFLEEFFITPKTESIAWLEFNSTWADLNLQPRDIKPVWKNFTRNFQSVTIVDTNLPGASRAYFQKRLGLGDYVYKKCFNEAEAESVPVKIFSKNTNVSAQVALVKNFTGRTLCVLPNEPKLAEMYAALSETATEDETEILAYKFSGSVAALKKKLKNFRGEKLTLLLTLHAFVKHWKTLPELEDLVIFKLPFEARGSKPPLLGLDDRSAFMDALLPRAISILHRTISGFLAAPGGRKEITILDPRILTDYDQSFMKYFEEFPDFRVSTG